MENKAAYWHVGLHVSVYKSWYNHGIASYH